MRRVIGLIMAAGLAVLLVTPLAQAEQVQIYGRAHMSVDWLDDGVDAGLNTSSNASRIGFRANTEVRPGLQAMMQLEQGFRLDNGSGSWATRDSFVGLQGDFGMLRLGLLQSPLMEIRPRVDLFGDRLGDIRNLSTLSDQYDSPAFDTRLRNSIHYRTPSFNGLAANLHYSTNDSSGASLDSSEDVLGSGLTYSTEALYLALAWQRGGQPDTQATRLAGTWRHDDWALMGFAQFTRLRAAGNVDTWGIGVSRRWQDLTFRGQVFTADASAAQRNATMWALGADWHAGARTSLYVVLATTRNDAQASYNMSAGGHGTQLDLRDRAGSNPQGVSIGLVFDF